MGSESERTFEPSLLSTSLERLSGLTKMVQDRGRQISFRSVFIPTKPGGQCDPKASAKRVSGTKEPAFCSLKGSIFRAGVNRKQRNGKDCLRSTPGVTLRIR